MKRVLIKDSLVAPPIVSQIKEEEDALKPLYDQTSTDKGPYYDPKYIHVHMWTNGFILYEQNQSDPFLSTKEKDKVSNMSSKTRYCIICGSVFKNIELSKTNITSIEKIEKLNFDKIIDQDYFNKTSKNLNNYMKFKNLNNVLTNDKNLDDKNLDDINNNSIFSKKRSYKSYVFLEPLENNI